MHNVEALEEVKSNYMIIGRLFRKGTIEAASRSSLVLANQENVSYNVDKSDVSI